jgi:hypothetical protein
MEYGRSGQNMGVRLSRSRIGWDTSARKASNKVFWRSDLRYFARASVLLNYLR